MELRVRTRSDARRATILDISGDVDLASVSRLRDDLARAVDKSSLEAASASDDAATASSDAATSGVEAMNEETADAATAPVPVILELSGVGFLDSSGVGALVGAFKRARILNVGFALAAPSPRVRRVLEIAGLMRALPIYPTLDDALRVLDESPRSALSETSSDSIDNAPGAAL